MASRTARSVALAEQQLPNSGCSESAGLSGLIAARGCSFRTALAAWFGLAISGAFLFNWLERDAELDRYRFNKAIYDSLTESVDFEHCHDPAFKNLGFCRRHEELEERLAMFFSRAGNSLSDRRQWTWLGSFFFVLQLGSTVGYATQGAPQTPGGQLGAILFGIVIIPLSGLVFVLASKSVLSCTEFLFNFLLGPHGGSDAERSRLLRLVLILVAILWPGCAGLFKILEGWSYPDALYFCFVTLTTVGFGTEVPTTHLSRVVCMIYIFVILSFGAGVLQILAKLKQNEEEAPLLLSRPLRRLFNPWVCLLLVGGLCCCGAFVFPPLERIAELARYERAKMMYEYLNSLASFEGCKNDMIGSLDFCKNAPNFRRSLKPYFGPDTPNSMIDRENWTPFGSASFMLSLSSTVGYGAHTPHTTAGKLATVLLGVLSIPLFIRYMFGAAGFLGGLVERLLRKARGHSAGDGEVVHASTATLALLVLSIWLFGSFVYVGLEADSGWSLPTSLYFCFVTLSGVGFSNVMPSSLAARVFTQVYIVVSLGTVASLLSNLVGQLAGDEEDGPEKPADESASVSRA